MTFLTKIANVKNANEKLDECSKFCERAIKIAKENVVNYELMEKGPDSIENVWLEYGLSCGIRVQTLKKSSIFGILFQS